MNAILDKTSETAESVISLTPAAVERVQWLIAKQNKGEMCLRVSVKGGGCSGLSYVLGLEPEPKPTDSVADISGLRVLVDPKSARFITGLEVDYTLQNLLEGGWKFTNPNAARSCGCGTSFTPA